MFTQKTLNQAEIMKVIPHRPPMLMLDEITDGNPESVTAVKYFSKDDFFIQGHFPQNPVIPGVLMIEAMAQASLVLYAYNYKLNRTFFLAKNKSRFLLPAIPD